MIIKWFYPPSWSRSSRKIHEHVVCTRKTKITSSGMLDILFELLSGDRLPFHLISGNLNVLSFMTCGLLPFESAQYLWHFEKKMIKTKIILLFLCFSNENSFLNYFIVSEFQSVSSMFVFILLNNIQLPVFVKCIMFCFIPFQLVWIFNSTCTCS